MTQQYDEATLRAVLAEIPNGAWRGPEIEKAFAQVRAKVEAMLPPPPVEPVIKFARAIAIEAMEDSKMPGTFAPMIAATRSGLRDDFPIIVAAARAYRRGRLDRALEDHEGHTLVPDEPMPEMVNAGLRQWYDDSAAHLTNYERMRAVYAAMRAAAPKP